MTETAPKKPWYTSKTLWFNTLAAMGVALESSLSIIQGSVRPEYYLALVVFITGGNVILRVLTTQELCK